MKETDFDFIIRYLEWEISRLTDASQKDTPGDMPSGSSSPIMDGMVGYLSNLLAWIKTAVKVERDRIQGARDSIDATLYALMSKSNLKCDEDFKKILDHTRGNKEKTSSQDIQDSAARLEHLRLELMGRNAENGVRKMQYIKQNETLAQSIELLTDLAVEKKLEGH